MDFTSILKQPEYQFLSTNLHLGKHMILLGLAGSYSYGTNNENSDIDLRGITLNSRSDLLGLTQFELYADDHTDTTIYSFRKMITLLLSCNPNTIELLGLKEEHYLYLHDIGRELLKNRSLFLSRKAVQSFGGYADAQLRRLQNALARDNYPQSEKEKHIFNSVKNAMHDFNTRYNKFGTGAAKSLSIQRHHRPDCGIQEGRSGNNATTGSSSEHSQGGEIPKGKYKDMQEYKLEEGSFRIYMDKSFNPDMDTEIFMDVRLKHYPLRDYKNIWNDMNNIVRDYDKLGKRNRKKDDSHLNKHAMHLIRLFMMAIDILEKGEINTFRSKEQKLLMSIRNGEFQRDDGSFRDEFYEMVADYEQKLDYAAAHTLLPAEPDMERVQDFVISVNEKALHLIP